MRIKKNISKGIKSRSNTKFFKLTSQELYSRQFGELLMRSCELRVNSQGLSNHRCRFECLSRLAGLRPDMSLLNFWSIAPLKNCLRLRVHNFTAYIPSTDHRDFSRSVNVSFMKSNQEGMNPLTQPRGVFVREKFTFCLAIITHQLHLHSVLSTPVSLTH